MNWRVTLLLAMWLGQYNGAALAEGNPVARIGQSGEFVEFEQESTGRSSRTLSLSIRRKGCGTSAPVSGLKNARRNIRHFP